MTSAAEERLAGAAEQLVATVAGSIGQWVVDSVVRVAEASGRHVGADMRAAAEAAGRRAGDEVPTSLAALLAQDPDEQRGTPLEVLREATRHPTDVLVAFDVPRVERDRFAVERFPSDVYDLVPATFADLGPEVGEAGLVWGAARALLHQARHGGPAPDQEMDDR